LSTRLDAQLAHFFGSDAIVEIFAPEEFIRRTRIAVRQLLSVHHYGLLARSVHYYNPKAKAELDVSDPRNLAFLKHEAYSYQSEFRLAFATRRAFKLVRQITMPHHDPFDDVVGKKPQQKLIAVGPMRDVARLVATNP